MRLLTRARHNALRVCTSVLLVFVILSCQGEGSGGRALPRGGKWVGALLAEGKGVGWSIASQVEGSGLEHICSGMFAPKRAVARSFSTLRLCVNPGELLLDLHERAVARKSPRSGVYSVQPASHEGQLCNLHKGLSSGRRACFPSASCSSVGHCIVHACYEEWMWNYCMYVWTYVMYLPTSR